MCSCRHGTFIQTWCTVAPIGSFSSCKWGCRKPFGCVELELELEKVMVVRNEGGDIFRGVGDGDLGGGVFKARDQRQVIRC